MSSSTSDSQASFSATVKNVLKQFYHDRCVTCLTSLPRDGAHCAHWFDRGGNGSVQLHHAVASGFINDGYSRSLSNNGMIQCPTCHLSYFTTKRVAYCPTSEVMEYILSLPEDDMRSIDDILAEVRATGSPPDVAFFIDYYQLVSIQDGPLHEVITTPQLPPLSQFDSNSLSFRPAPLDIDPAGENVFRIFDVVNAPPISPTDKLGRIVFSDMWPEFHERRLWRLHNSPGTVFAYLWLRFPPMSSDMSEDLLTFGNLCTNRVGRRFRILRKGGKGHHGGGPDSDQGIGHKRVMELRPSGRYSGSALQAQSSSSGGPSGGADNIQDKAMISDGNSSDKDGSPSADNDSLSDSEEGDISTAPSRQSFSPPQKPRKDADFDLIFGPEFTAMDIIYMSGGPKPIRGYHPRSEEELDAAEALVRSERQL